MLSLTPLFWFHDGMILAGGDESILLNPGAMIKSTFWAWNPIFNGGNPVGDYQGNGAHLFPFIVFWFGLIKAGLSLIIIEKLWFVVTWFGTGLGIYFLAQVLIKDKAKANIFSIIIASVYLFNIYIMQYVLMYTVRLPIMIMPWTLALMIRGLENPEKKIRYAILFGIACVLGASGWVNPPAAVIVILVPVLYWILFVCYKKKLKDPIKFLGLALLFFVIFNIYWLYPFVLNLLKTMTEIKSSGTSNFFQTASLFDPFRFLGSWAFREFSNKIAYFPLNELYYNTKIFIISSYLIIIISFAGLFFINEIKKNKKIIFFLLLTCISLFLVKGPQEPLKQINMFLYEHIPGFWMFREPYAKFMPVATLSISVLFGYATIFIADFLRKITKRQLLAKIVYMIAIIIVLATAIPIPLGASIWQYTDGPARSYYAKVPEYWKDMGNYLSSTDPYSSVLVLPKNGANSTTYNWDSGFTLKGSVANYFIENPYLYYQHVPMYLGEKVVRDIYDDVLESDGSKLANKLGFFGVKYILNQRDIDWQYTTDEDIADSRKSIEYVDNKNGIYKVATYDKLDLFEISDNIVMPKVSVGVEPFCTKNTNGLDKKTVGILNASTILENNIFLLSSNDHCPSDTNFAENFQLGENNINIDSNNIELNFESTNQKLYYLVFSHNIDVENNIKIYLDGNLINDNNIKISQENNKQYYKVNLGKLDSKQHKINLDSAARELNMSTDYLENIESANSQAENSNGWEVINMTNEKEKDKISIASSSDSTEVSGRSITLNAKNTVATLRGKVKLEKENNYHLGFYYKNDKDNSVSYRIDFIDSEGKVTESISDNLDSANSWTKEDTYFNAKTDEAYIYLSNNSENANQEVGFDNISLDKLFLDPDSIVIENDSSSEIKNISFERINPTKYEVQINTNSAFYLNFMESYDSDWEVYVKETGEKLSDTKNHFILNGFANSWKIDKTGNYTLITEYKRQKTLTILYIISIVTIIFGICYAIKKK